MDDRDRLIWRIVVVHSRYGGVSAREINREVRREIPTATIQHRLTKWKEEGLLAQTKGDKYTLSLAVYNKMNAVFPILSDEERGEIMAQLQELLKGYSPDDDSSDGKGTGR